MVFPIHEISAIAMPFQSSLFLSDAFVFTSSAQVGTFLIFSLILIAKTFCFEFNQANSISRPKYFFPIVSSLRTLSDEFH